VLWYRICTLYEGKVSKISRNQATHAMSALRKQYSMAAMISGPMQVIFATVLPPLSVFCAVGLRSQFWLNLVFTLLGYVPGVVHAFHVLLSSDPERSP
jgi:uncharacterized membrane protein YqaE (UPF0057 family)